MECSLLSLPQEPTLILTSVLLWCSAKDVSLSSYVYLLVLKCVFFSLHLQSNGLPSWCNASLLSAGRIHPCLCDMLRHLSRMRVDNPQQISLIKARRDTDPNIFTAGGGLQKPSAMKFLSLPRSAQRKVTEKMPFGLSVAPLLPNVVILHHELLSCSFNVFRECRDTHPY